MVLPRTPSQVGRQTKLRLQTHRGSGAAATDSLKATGGRRERPQVATALHAQNPAACRRTCANKRRKSGVSGFRRICIKRCEADFDALVRGVRQQGDHARALDRDGQLALVLWRRCRSCGRVQDFAALVGEAAQARHVLVIDVLEPCPRRTCTPCGGACGRRGLRSRRSPLSSDIGGSSLNPWSVLAWITARCKSAALDKPSDGRLEGKLVVVVRVRERSGRSCPGSRPAHAAAARRPRGYRFRRVRPCRR